MAEYVQDVWSTEVREIMPGFRGHFVHSEHTTHVFWDVDEGASVPDHSIRTSRSSTCSRARSSWSWTEPAMC